MPAYLYISHTQINSIQNLLIMKKSFVHIIIIFSLALSILSMSSCRDNPLDNLDCEVDIISLFADLTTFSPGTDLTGFYEVTEEVDIVDNAMIQEMVQLYLSNDALFSDDDTKLNFATANVTNDETTTKVEWSLVIPFEVTPGSYYLVARINNQEWVCGTEGDETAYITAATEVLSVTIQ